MEFSWKALLFGCIVTKENKTLNRILVIVVKWRHHANGPFGSYSFPRVKETFRFEDKDDYDDEIWLQVFSRILEI